MQPKRSLEENLEDLPKDCDKGGKKNSKCHASYWVGYKLHADVIDGDIPVSLALTSERRCTIPRRRFRWLR